jgi:hypothetical protein
VEHAYHPGGGLHHAMPDRASGFCIYDDPALAIAWARRAGWRVLYVDLDVHHGDGVQAIHYADPGVLTISFHESGDYLFPGTGSPDELGVGTAAGTAVNVPLEPWTGERAWLRAVESVVPPLAAAFAPDIVVSQHGADSHAWDPLAHLRVTTTAMGSAARLVDRIAHRRARGCWLATGGGGYDVYRVVPRAWALTWLAAAHREAPAETPPAWRERWGAEAARYGQAPPSQRFEDEPNAGVSVDTGQDAAEAQAERMVELVRRIFVPALLREAQDLGWWSPGTSGIAGASNRGEAVGVATQPEIIGPLAAAQLDRLRLAPRVVAPADPGEALELLRAAASHDGVDLVAAVSGDLIVGVALSAPAPGAMLEDRLLAVGVAPGARRQGLAHSLLGRFLSVRRAPDRPLIATFSVAERDPFEPVPVDMRQQIATRLLERAGFEVRQSVGALGRFDRSAIDAVLRPPETG